MIVVIILTASTMMVLSHADACVASQKRIKKLRIAEIAVSGSTFSITEKYCFFKLVYACN